MLTKRLYRFDEVRAAFLYCLKQGRMNEALFWLEELEDSRYGNEVRRLLFVSWMMRIGIRRLAWLEAWSVDSETREGRWRLCKQLLWCKERDSSIWWLLWSVVVGGTLPEAPGHLFSIWLSSCKKEEEAFWQPLVDSSTDIRIDRILEALQCNMNAYSIFAKATAVIVVYGASRVPTSTWLSLTIPSLDTYTAIVGSSLRSQRLYSIPYDCLYGLTWRGAGGTTTEELCTFGFDTCKASAYWRQCITDSMDVEAFWDTHFPWVTCDHPDEWSAADREKSHGSGLPEGPLLRWWINWIGHERLFVWGIVHTNVLTWVKQQRTSSQSILDTLLGLYKTFHYTGHSYTYPMKKEFLLMGKETMV